MVAGILTNLIAIAPAQKRGRCWVRGHHSPSRPAPTKSSLLFDEPQGVVEGSPLRPVLPRPKPAYAPQTFSTSLKPKLFAASPVHPLPWAALPQLPLARRDFPTKKKYRLPAASPMCPIWGIASKALLSAYPWFPQAAVIPSGRSRRDQARPDGGKPHVKRSTVYRSRSMTRPSLVTAICARHRGNLHRSRHEQSQSGRSRDGRSLGEQSQSG
jgi:hypothetical protein